MRHKLQLQTLTKIRDDHGQPIDNWANEGGLIPCDWEQVNGYESYRGRQIQAQVVAVFVIRKGPTVTPTMRLIHNGVTYGIVSTFTDFSRIDGRQYTEIMAKAFV